MRSLLRHPGTGRGLACTTVRRRVHRGQRPRRTGAVLVEFAVTVGLVFFLFMAAVEFCRVSMMRHTVEHALYEGARHGIVPGATPAEVRDRASRVLRTIGVTSATIDVSPAALSTSTPEVSVRIQVPLDRGLFGPVVFFRGRSLDRTLVMQREGSR